MKTQAVSQTRVAPPSFELALPASKSLSNRLLILSALAEGETILHGDLRAEDIQLMLGALKQLGISIEENASSVTIQNDLSWRESKESLELFLGNSGTSVRFLSSLVALRSGSTALTGKQRMKERPIGDLIDALKQIEVDVSYQEQEGFPPVVINGKGRVRGGQVDLSGSTSSQFLTSLLLSAPVFETPLELNIVGELISQPYVDMTVELLKEWGVNVSWEENILQVEPTPLKAKEITVEGDASAATYWWALGYLHGSEITFSNLSSDGQGDARFQDILDQLGPERMGIDIDMNDLPDASMTLMAIAPLLSSPTTIRNIASLRVKETDRIEAMATELRKVGAQVETGEDWITISPLNLDPRGCGSPIEIDTYDDHRVAMSMAVLGTVLGGLVIRDPDCVNKTYPGF